MNYLDKNRSSNFELLRIISMLFIILHHFCIYNNYQFNKYITLNDISFSFFRCGGKLGVCLFVMTTGYFMIKKNIKFNKLIELEIQVLFYSIGTYLIFIIFFHKEFILNEFIKCLFPNSFKLYWFFSSYFILYLCIPYLNKLILSITKKEFFSLLIIGFVFLILIPSIIFINKTIPDTIYVFYYYMIGSYIRLYVKNIHWKFRLLGICFIMYMYIVFIFTYLNILSLSNSSLQQYTFIISHFSSILVFICAISLFLFFKNISISKNKIINYLASFSFGVYLFHEHIFMRDYLWGDLFNINKIIKTKNIFLYGLLVAVTIYIAGSLIELIRILLFSKIRQKKVWNNLFYNNIKKIKLMYDNCYIYVNKIFKY